MRAFNLDDYLAPYERRRELWMTGGAASAGGSGSGGTVFIPPNQTGAAGAMGDIFGPLAALSGGAGAGTPGGVNYPLAQQQVYGDILNPGFQNQAISGAQNAQDIAFNQAVPQALSGGKELFDYASGGLPWSSQALSQGFDPAYQNAIGGIQNNPFYGQQLAGAQTGATMGMQGANALQGLAGQIGGQVPQLQGLAGQMGGAVQPLLNSGFDPRSALFNRSQGRLMDQSNAANAMSGIASTPYGASVTSNAMGNFDIDWQNQQLARQAQATGAAGQAAGQAGNLYGAAGQAAGQAGNLYGAAPGLAASTAGLPSNVYTGQIGQELSALDARNKGAIQGIAGYGSLMDNARQGFAGANTANLQGAGAQQQFGAAPYNTAAGIGANSLSGLSNLTNLGNNQFLLPQQAIGDLMQYMGLGQSASNISGNLGNMGFNQLSQGLGGALSGANTLFNPSSGLLTGSGGLLSGLGGGGLSGVEAASAAGAFGGGGELAAGGIGDALASAAPLALSA